MRAFLTVGVGVLLLVSASTVHAAGLTTVASFNAALGEFPEGLAIDADGNLYVGMAPTGEIKRVTPAGQVSTFARLPSPGEGFLVGLAFDSAGNLYAALASFDAATHGVWLITPDGATQLRVVVLPPDGLPNAIVFDGDDNMFVSDSARGVIWRVGADGDPQVWSDHESLRGNIPPITAVGLPIGVNGIAFDPTGASLYAVNTEFGQLVRFPVNADGSAGTPQDVSSDPLLLGSDGLAVSADGTVYVAAGVQFVEGAGQRLLSVSPAGDVTLLASGEPLRFPASLALDAAGQTLYITNFDADRALGLTPGDPAPALLALTLADAPIAPAPAPTGHGLLDGSAGGGQAPLALVLLAGTLLLAAGARRRVRRVGVR